VNRVWTALLLLATVFVAGAVVYVLGHNDKVAQAGTVITSVSSPSGSGSPTGSGTATSGSASHSPSPSGSASAGAPRTIVFLGDDWTAGVGTSSPARRFTSILGAALHARVVVVAAAGAGYAKKGPSTESYVELAPKAVAAKPYMVVVSGGRNDVSDDPDTLKNDAKTVFGELRSGLPTARIVAIAPFYGDSDAPAGMDAVVSAVKSGVGGDVHGTYVDVADPINGNKSDMSSNQADPNDAGNAAIATALLPYLQAAITAPIPTSAPSSTSNHNSGKGKGSGKSGKNG
jgi:lysophospholipase L1-like esterase